jgi:hypothetical protein
MNFKKLALIFYGFSAVSGWATINFLLMQDIVYTLTKFHAWTEVVRVITGE